MSAQSTRRVEQSRKKMKPKSERVTNPLQAGVTAFLATRHLSSSLQLNDIPKRYTRYGTLLLLGPTFYSHSVRWKDFLGTLTGPGRTALFEHIIKAFKDSTLTHVAINAPIAAVKTEHGRDEDNVVRSPTGLQPGYGDFGPGIGECDECYPTPADLDAAYWTHVVQLKNIVQVWAPRWTMFSRGNVSEKARILQSDQSNSPFPGLTDSELYEGVDTIDVVDFYVGIGYFAFCYLKRGVARVWGWEINGWSVEGLRRGCISNGWGIRVVAIDETGSLKHNETLESLTAEIQDLDGTSDAIRCVVFWGDNKWASKILNELKSLMTRSGNGSGLNIKHCNLGLLPSSRNSWEGAIQVIDAEKGGWLHVHENVEVSVLSTKQEDIVNSLKNIASTYHGRSWSALCCHRELVKTYAPGIIHCVYDIKLYPDR